MRTPFFRDELYGVTERLNKNTLIKGEMQNYLKDFIIHEIDLRGKEATLTTTACPGKVPTDVVAMKKLPFIEKGFMTLSGFDFMLQKIKTGLRFSKEPFFDVSLWFFFVGKFLAIGFFLD